MKYLHDFKSYILTEAFDLKRMYQKQNIIPEFQEEASKLVERKFKTAATVPADMQRDKDKVKLWLARQIKTEAIKFAKEYVDTEYSRVNSGINGGDTRFLEEANFLLDTYKGKNTDKHRLEAKIKGREGNDKEITDYDVEEEKRSILSYWNDTIINSMTNRLTGIFDYFLSDLRNQHEAVDLVTTSLLDMWQIQDEWHKSLKASGRIIKQEGRMLKRYPDGYYWIDLLTNDSPEEGDAMGHCGRTSADTLLSLRKKSDGGYFEPFVTIAINYKPGQENKFYSIQQCKGKNNTKPVEKYHPYIVDFLTDDNFDVETVSNDEYDSSEDFHITDLQHDVIKNILAKKPDLFSNTRDVIMLYKNGFYDDEYTNNLVRTEGIFVENQSIFTYLQNLESFRFAFKTHDNSRNYGYGSFHSFNHREKFSHYANALKTKHGFYDNMLEFSLEDDYGYLNEESISLILSNINEEELTNLSSQDKELLNEAEIDMDNILNDVLNNDCDFKNKLVALLCINSKSIYRLNRNLIKVYREYRSECDRKTVLSYILELLSDSFGTSLQPYKDGYIFELPDWAIEHNCFDIEDVCSLSTNELMIDFDKLYEYEEFNQDDFSKALKEALSNEIY
jgi:hypothetical protein